ncbi:MAG: hypothetical protein ABH983_02570 [Candidatus Micrarchaeota archaeon]|nr:hypothetical protein [Candidatus Micrarchaeota archaeon]MBU1681871.1 hypothetical protein [Candidatus Micrarchaeota archaeon]
MKIIYLLLVGLLLFGCAAPVDRGNVSQNTTSSLQPEDNISENQTIENETVQNQTEQVQRPYIRYNASQFSFEYPDNMEVDESTGIFSGIHNINGQTGELMVVVYYNTKTAFGENQDKIFQENPSAAVSTLLDEDMEDDQAQILHLAQDVGEVSTYSIGRDAEIAEVPIKLKFPDSKVTYQGYAFDLYSPERSLHAKVRILAIDKDLAEDIRDNFLLSFRME